MRTLAMGYLKLEVYVSQPLIIVNKFNPVRFPQQFHAYNYQEICANKCTNIPSVSWVWLNYDVHSAISTALHNEIRYSWQQSYENSLTIVRVPLEQQISPSLQQIHVSLTLCNLAQLTSARLDQILVVMTTNSHGSVFDYPQLSKQLILSKTYLQINQVRAYHRELVLVMKVTPITQYYCAIVRQHSQGQKVRFLNQKEVPQCLQGKQKPEGNLETELGLSDLNNTPDGVISQNIYLLFD